MNKLRWLILTAILALTLMLGTAVYAIGSPQASDPLPQAPTETLPHGEAIAFTGAAPGTDQGIQSVANSFVAFDPTLGGDSCYAPDSTSTLCFRTESFTTDYEYILSLWQQFPADWTVTDVYIQGTPTCDVGTVWGAFSWLSPTTPYEVSIYHTRYQQPVDHCVATYCFVVTTGSSTSGIALASWYWDGDGMGSTPHNPCSWDGYTPAGQTACDETAYPPAEIPQCIVSVNPPAQEAAGCPGISQEHVFNLTNQTGSDGYFYPSYHVDSGLADFSGPEWVYALDGDTVPITTTIWPYSCAAGPVIATIDVTGNGYHSSAVITKTVFTDPIYWNSVNDSAPPWGTGAYPRDGCTAQNSAGDWITYMIGDTSGFSGFWGYNHVTNTWFEPAPAGLPADRWAPDWAYDASTNLCYLTGGATGAGGGDLNSAYVFDPVANTFTALGSFTSARDFHTSWIGVLNGVKYLCIGGGVNASSTLIQSTQCYNLSQAHPGTWNAENAQIAALPTDPFGAADGVLYAAAGDQFWYVGGAINAFATVTDQAWYWDDADDAWHSAGNTGVPRYRVEGDFYNGAFYQLGGASAGFSYTDSVVRGDYDGANWVWTPMNPLSNARMDNVVAVTPDNVWSVTGSGSNAADHVDFMDLCPACEPSDIEVNPVSLHSIQPAGWVLYRGLEICNWGSDPLQWDIYEIPHIAWLDGLPKLSSGPALPAALSSSGLTEVDLPPAETETTSPGSLPASQETLASGPVRPLAVTGGKLYLTSLDIGGIGDDYFAVYDPATNAWTTLTPYETGCSMAVDIAGNLYAYGHDTDTIDRYHPGTDTWSAVMAAPPGTNGAYCNLEITNQGQFIYTQAQNSTLWYTSGGAWNSLAMGFTGNIMGDYDPTTDQYIVGEFSTVNAHLFDVHDWSVTHFTAGPGTNGEYARFASILDGHYYYQTSANIYSYDLSSPATPGTDHGFPAYYPSSAVDRVNQVIYVAGLYLDTLSLFDPAAGTLTPLAAPTGSGAHSSLAYAVPTDVPWLSEDPENGVVAAATCQIIDVAFDAHGMSTGDEVYANLQILSSDPDEPEIIVPVTMTLAEAYWDKEVWINGVMYNPHDSPFTAMVGDEVTVIDRVWFDDMYEPINFRLTDHWDHALELRDYTADFGTITTTVDTLSWRGVGASPAITYTLEKTFDVVDADMFQFYLEEIFLAENMGMGQYIKVNFNIPVIAEKTAPSNAEYDDIIPYVITLDFPGVSYGTAVLTDVLPAGVEFAGNLTANFGTAWHDQGTIYWDGFPTQRAASDVLWEQTLSLTNTSAYVDQEFTDFPAYSSYLADDFVIDTFWTIDSIFIPGDGWGGFTTLLDADALTWEIYADAGGVPDGNPEGGSPPLWSLTLLPTDPQVSITSGSIGLPSNTLLTLSTPVGLPVGHYWLVFYPTGAYATFGQYGRQPADTTNGYTAQFINPGNGFGYGTIWQDWLVLGAGLTQKDMAFRIDGLAEPGGPSTITISFDVQVTLETGGEITNTVHGSYNSHAFEAQAVTAVPEAFNKIFIPTLLKR